METFSLIRLYHALYQPAMVVPQILHSDRRAIYTLFHQYPSPILRLHPHESPYLFQLEWH